MWTVVKKDLEQLEVGTLVAIRRSNDETLAVGPVVKVNTASFDVKAQVGANQTVLRFKANETFNQFRADKYDREVRKYLNYSEAYILEAEDSPTKQQAEADEKWNEVKKDEADRRQAKEDERLEAQRKHLEEVETFWRTEGEAIWRNRREMTVGGIKLVVLERMLTHDPNSKWEQDRFAKVAMISMTERVDDFEAGMAERENREPKHTWHIERGGIEVRKGYFADLAGEKVKYPSFWSRSSYELPIVGFEKELVYNEVGN